MAEFFAVLGAVQTSCDILKSIAGIVQRYRALSEQLYDAREELGGAVVELDAWRRLWKVRSGRHESYYIEIFGSQGWKEIRTRLGSIRDIMEEVNVQTDFIARGTVGRATRRKSHIYDDRYDPDLARHAVQHISRNFTKRRKFFWALTDRASDLQNQLLRLDKKLISLDRFSRRCAETLWPGTFGPISDMSWKRQRLITAPSAADGKKVQAQVKRLHHARDTNGKIACIVGLNTPRPNGKGRSLTALEVVLRENKQDMELLLRPEELETHAKAKQSFADAAQDLRHSNSAKETYLRPSGTLDEQGYIVTIPSQRVLSQVVLKDDLATRLEKARNVGGNELLSQEYRTAMTTSLVDGCFRFLGSEWLDHLDVQNIQGGRGAQGIWKMALSSPNKGPRNLDSQLEGIKTAAQNSRAKRDLTKHTHMFRLSLVLIELLLDCSVSQVQKKDGRYVMDVFIRSIQEHAITAEDVADRVQEKCRSQTLGDLIFFCLTTLQDAELVQEQQIDEKFYAKAFLPAYEMSNALVRRRGS